MGAEAGTAADPKEEDPTEEEREIKMIINLNVGYNR